MSFTLHGNDKLKSRKTIEQLFSEGRTVTKFPLKMLFLPLDGLKSNQAAFAVPKRNFKLAVSRNRIKRKMREAYRLNKKLGATNNGTKYALMFLYISKDDSDHESISSAMVNLLKTLQQ